MQACKRQLTHHHHHLPPQYEALYKKSIEDPNAFWAEIGKQFHWEKPVSMFVASDVA